jgi:uncharacterized membrane protein
MKTEQYSFITRWKVAAPIEQVWEAIYQSEQWPEWWKGVKEVSVLQPGNADGIGAVRRYKIQSPFKYLLTFELTLTEYEVQRTLKGDAKGDLVGVGAWHMEEKNGQTEVECHWDVATTKAWMNTFAFILRPAFHYNHTMVMKWGAISLSKKLGVPVAHLS